MTALVTSTPMSIAADVTIKELFGRFNAAKAMPLNVPPVPTKPARNPANDPLLINVVGFVGSCNFGFTKNRIENNTRKIARENSRISDLNVLVKMAPKATKIIPGTPSSIRVFKLIFFKNRMSLLILLKTCKTAVMASTVLKSKNNEAKGTKKTLEPKPLMVPIISAIKARL